MSPSRRGDGRAPICPACGVTALPAAPLPTVDPDFVCDNDDCPEYGQIVA